MKTATAAALIAAAAFTAATTTAATASTAPPCTASSLRATVTHQRAAVGSDTASLVLTNTGRDCTVRGYPSLRLVTRSGTAAAAVTRGLVQGHADPGARTVTLRHGQSAHAWIGWGDDGTFGAVNATGIAVRIGRRTVVARFAAQVYRGRINETAFAPGRK